MSEAVTLIKPLPGDRWADAWKELKKAQELQRVYEAIKDHHGPWLEIRLQHVKADIEYWSAQVARLQPKHHLMIDRLYPGPGMRMTCSCGEWEARGMRPFSLDETDARVSFQLHAEQL